MEGALHDVAEEHALAERAAAMRALVLEGVKFAVDVGDRDLSAVNLDDGHLARRYLVRAGNLHKLAHGILLLSNGWLANHSTGTQVAASSRVV